MHSIMSIISSANIDFNNAYIAMPCAVLWGLVMPLFFSRSVLGEYMSTRFPFE